MKESTNTIKFGENNQIKIKNIKTFLNIVLDALNLNHQILKT